MIKLKKLLNEHAWDRKFGEPLPTLKDVVEKHNNDIEESAGDIVKAKKIVQKITKIESKFRSEMLELFYKINEDKENSELAKSLKISYKNTVTKFMREMLSLVKRMK